MHIFNIVSIIQKMRSISTYLIHFILFKQATIGYLDVITHPLLHYIFSSFVIFPNLLIQSKILSWTTS